MRTPTVDMDPETLFGEFGHFHLWILEKHPEHADLYEAFKKVQDELKEFYFSDHHVKEIRVEVMREGIHEAAQEILEDVARFEEDLRKLCNGDTECEEYRKYFPKDAPPLTSLKPVARLKRVIKIADTLAEDEDYGIRVHEMLLALGIETLDDQIHEWKEADKEEIENRAVLLEYKKRWMERYKQDYLELRARYRGQPGEAERFFWKTPKPGNGGGPVDWDDPVEEEVLRPIEPPIDMGGPMSETGQRQ